MSKSAKQLAAALTTQELATWLAEVDEATLRDIERDAWWWVRRPEQATPPGDWFIWLILSGRGWGKTRTGAEWLVDQALDYPRDLDGNATQWVIIGETLADTRTFCIDGPSGIKAALRRRGLVEGRDWSYIKAPKPIITLLKHGQEIYFEGCDDTDTGRGYNAAGMWLDELAKWRYAYDAWREGIMPSVRANLPDGGRPRVVVTTTPKPVQIIKGWVKRAKSGDRFVHLTVGATYDNFANLSIHTIRELRTEYEGTTLGRQELHGELLEDVEGALWTLATIERLRVKPADVPEWKSIVVGMDPPGTGTGDECGLVVVARGADDEDYVLGDYSRKMSGGPRAAARLAWQIWAEHEADWLVAEDNLAKEWLRQVLVDAWDELSEQERDAAAALEEMGQEMALQYEGRPPLKTITATKGKRLRAQPVAMRYEQGRCHHVGIWPELEDQMVTWIPDESPDSPDRVDALVHAQAWHRDRERLRANMSEPSEQAMPVMNPYG
jgi:phage terminase large subunit-like protein